MIEPVTLDCPYCGESFQSTVDLSAGSQVYVEDCAVCCRPITVVVEVDASGDLARLATRRDDD
jgi:hypothetical protein